MTAPGVAPCRMQCPECGQVLTQVVLSSVSQMFTPQSKVLRQTFRLHGVALAKARPRMLVVQCPSALTPVEGPPGIVALGELEVAEYERARKAPGPAPAQGAAAVGDDQQVHGLAGGGVALPADRRVVPAEVRPAPRRRSQS